MSKEQEVREEIVRYMVYEEFTRIQGRLAELRSEEDAKLQALAELQKAYLSASSDAQRESVKVMVGKVREMSKIARQEIRELNQEICKYMTLEKARELYQRLRDARNLPEKV